MTKPVGLEFTSILVFSIHPDGSVTFGEGFTADDAAKEFWRHVGLAKCGDKL